MAESIKDYVLRLQKVKKFLNTELPIRVAEIASNDLVALITNRVIQRSEDASGKKFGPYSEVGRSWRFYEEAILAASGKGKLEAVKKFAAQKYLRSPEAKNAKPKKLKKGEVEKVKYANVSYAEVREILGFKNKNQNFQFTGEMWMKFGVIKEIMNDEGFTITLGGKTTEAQNKIEENTEREGGVLGGKSIIDNSEEEYTLIQEIVKEIVEMEINRILNE